MQYLIQNILYSIQYAVDTSYSIQQAIYYRIFIACYTVFTIYSSCTDFPISRNRCLNIGPVLFRLLTKDLAYTIEYIVNTVQNVRNILQYIAYCKEYQVSTGYHMLYRICCIRYCISYKVSCLLFLQHRIEHRQYGIQYIVYSILTILVHYQMNVGTLGTKLRNGQKSYIQSKLTFGPLM